MNTFPSTVCHLVALALILPCIPTYAGDFPIQDGLVGYYEANDLLKSIKPGERVTSWPGVVGDPFTTDGNVGPVLVDSSETGLPTAAVRFTPPERSANDPLDYKLGEYLNFPEVHEAGQFLNEVTLVFAGSRLRNAGLFDTNPGLDPTFRHLGFIQFTDSTSGGAVDNALDGFTLDAQVVLMVVISRSGDGLATLTTYVDGEITGQMKQTARNASVPMEPFEGVRFARPRNGEGEDGAVRPGANIGTAEMILGNSDLFAFAIFSKALTPQEVLKLSDYLRKKFNIE